MKNMITCGIDIGTTTLSAVVCDIEQGKQLDSFTLEHKASIDSDKSFESIQDADKILSLSLELLDNILERYPDISSIGTTGQMHGILYTDQKGNACSPLYTWQDARGSCLTKEGISYCEKINRLTSYNTASGFGLVTHYYNTCNGLVPKTACSFCSIMDYLVMKLCGLSHPICHPSVAASFGLYDIKTKSFDNEALKKLSLDGIALPDIIQTEDFAGEYKGIRVTAALGDNQASVYGSVADEDKSVLVNYGTGSQVSVISDMTEAEKPLEIRPYIGGKNLICGCALCGGYAYEVLERFFRSYAAALGIEDNQYQIMDTLAARAYEAKKEPLCVSPLFKGTRENSNIRASVEDISDANFTAEQLILGMVYGMADELYNMFLLSAINDKSKLVASGNGVRKNVILQRILSERFSSELFLLESKEEAAMGAAMYSALCGGISSDIIKGCISYK